MFLFPFVAFDGGVWGACVDGAIIELTSPAAPWTRYYATHCTPREASIDDDLSNTRSNVGSTTLAARRTIEVGLSYAIAQLGAWVTPGLLDSGAGAEQDTTDDWGAAAVTLHS